MPSKEFVASRARVAVAFAICLIFVAAAVLLPHASGASSVWRVATIAFFGLGLLVFAAQIARPQRLVLDDTGFTISGGLVISPKKIPWRDVDRFFVYRLAPGRKMIGFNYRPGIRDSSLLINFNRGTAGADGALPGLWRDSYERIVSELNEYRERAA